MERPLDLDDFLPAIVARDAEAFAGWMAGAEAPIRESLRSFARVVDVEAVLQEALLRVWHVAPRFVPDGAPNGLLRLGVRIARNLAISEVRRTKAGPVPEGDVAELAAFEPALPDPLLRQVLARCYELLPPQPRRVLELRLHHPGEPDVTLAEKISMRVNTFLQNFGRARKLLAECLRKSDVAVDPELLA